MTESEAKKMAKRKRGNNNSERQKGPDGWFYRAAAKAGFPGGWVVERRRSDGHGWSIFRSSAN